MRYSQQHRAEARSRILAAAAHAIRERGLADASVVHIMGRAGLTHGAFYHHFTDRDALLAEAVSVAAVETSDRVFAADVDRASMLNMYCSPDHVAAPGSGCVLAALGTDAVHHAAAPMRAAFAAVARGFLHHVARVLRASGDIIPGADAATPKTSARHVPDDALSLASRMIGAVVLARLVDDPRLAARILAAARQ